jgi:hypothetical protein
MRSFIKSSVMKWVGHIARIGEMKKYPKFSVGKSEPLGRPRRRWEDIITMDVKRNRLGGFGLNSFGSGYGPVGGSCEHVMNLRVPQKAGNFLPS